MAEKITHTINENSVFFQGHKGQYFSKRNTSFRIQQHKGKAIDGTEGINYRRYISLFGREINRKIGLRNEGGGKMDYVSLPELKVKVIKLVDDETDEGYCGKFKLHPPTALCKEEGCNTFFVVGDGRRCDHDQDARSEQLTFLAVCDKCGRTLPIHYMTNIGNDCDECNSSNSMNKLGWQRQDDMGTYYVKCTNCGNSNGLYFYRCNHEDEKRSSKEHKRFRGVPARSNAILHPSVLTTPYIPEKEEKNSVDSLNFSNSFEEFFSLEIDQALLTLPRFLDELDDEFWKLGEISRAIRFNEGLDDSNIDEWKKKDKISIIKKIIKDAYNHLSQDGSNRDMIIDEFGLDYIKNAIGNIKGLNFDQHDRQGFLLSQAGEEIGKSNYFETPKSMDSKMWDEFCENFKIRGVKFFQNLTMIQALLGTITGSGRKKNPLFRPIKTGPKGNKKPTVYVRDFNTEGLLLELDPKDVAVWLEKNEYSFNYQEENVERKLRDFMMRNKNVRKQVFTLLHTISHMMIQESTKSTGLDVRSLSEEIFPLNFGVFLYSTNTINIGGLESTYHNEMNKWVERAIELSKDCPQDPACMIHEEGSCNACSYLPEFVCSNFNKNINRATLAGDGDEIFGYLE